MKLAIDRLTSSRSEVIDLSAVLVLTALALYGFRSSFSGYSYLLVGLSAAILGCAVAWLSVKLGSNLVTGVALILVTFVLAGQGLATRGRALGGVVPTPDALSGLVDGLLHGWTRLLTSLPRAGTEDNVLAVPYLAGFLTAMASTLLSLRVKKWPLCALPPLALIAVTVLLGSRHPASLALQGGVLAIVTLAWMSFRHVRLTPNVTEGLSRRLLRAAALLAVAGLIGVLGGPYLPFAQAHERFVLRDHVTPPLDLSNRPSPLGAFRTWLVPDRANATQLVVDHWPQGARVRIAAMDSYDGLVWNLAGVAPGSSAVYERVGTTLPTADPGTSTEVTFHPGPLLTPYVPTVGEIRSISGGGPRADELFTDLRVSRSTETALQTAAGYQSTDAYVVQAVLPAAVPDSKKATIAFDPRVPPVISSVNLPSDLKAQFDTALADVPSMYGKAQALTKLFHDQGYFSDGGRGTKVAPGHSLVRLLPILMHPERAQGDAEQYAAAMALVARAEGMPARVVLGFRPTGSGHVEIKGSDIDAWVEIAFDHIGWVPFDPTPDKNRTDVPALPAQPRQQKVRSQVPPLHTPRVVPRPQTLAKADQKLTTPRAKVVHTRSLVLRVLLKALEVLLALLALASPLFAVVALKRRRRGRRRTFGTPAQQIAAGWAELLDLAVDLRRPLPSRATRVELAHALGDEHLAPLAAQADEASFSASPPVPTTADAYWTNVDRTRGQMLSTLGRQERLRALFSVRSLRTTQ